MIKEQTRMDKNINNNKRIEFYRTINDLAQSFNARMPRRSEITVNAFNEAQGSLTFDSDFDDYQIDKIEVGLIVHDFFDEKEKSISKDIFTEFLGKLPLSFTPGSDEPEEVYPDGGAWNAFEWISYSCNFAKQND